RLHGHLNQGLMKQLLIAYSILGLAIVSEVAGSSLLPKTAGFTKVGPTIVVIVCYVIAFYLLSHVVKTIPLGVTYAIWSGVGIILTAAVSVFVYRLPLDWPALIGIGLIVSGVVVMNLFSKSISH